MLLMKLKNWVFCVLDNCSYICLLEAISKSSSIELIEMRLKERSDMGWQPDKFTL